MYEKFGIYPDSKDDSLKSSMFAIRKLYLEIVFRVACRDPRLGAERPVKRLEE